MDDINDNSNTNDDENRTRSNNDDNDDDGGDESVDSLGFLNMDMSNVDFDNHQQDGDGETSIILMIEKKLVLGEPSNFLPARDGGDGGDGDIDATAAKSISLEEESNVVMGLAKMMSEGRFIDILKSQSAHGIFQNAPTSTDGASATDSICRSILSAVSSLTTLQQLVEAEFVAVAALNLFLQFNYTGPSLDDDSTYRDINPHSTFLSHDRETEVKNYHNSVLAELAVDGVWPCNVAKAPYFLLLARAILSALAGADEFGWSASLHFQVPQMSHQFRQIAKQLKGASLWNARAAVAHERLLLGYEPTNTLWAEVEAMFTTCVQSFASDSAALRAKVYLEFGLACFHFQKVKRAKELFDLASKASGLTFEVTGALGKRTKFQSESKAQMLVRATSTRRDQSSRDVVHRSGTDATASTNAVTAQMVSHTEESVLLENVNFDDDVDNKLATLTVLDQAILMAYCLDVKYNNPTDGLTAEQMAAFLARVLHHHDDWMVYSTALLERAWLEFKGNHTKERSILQMQALADQHSNRLTITQSTRESIEDSSPVQERLKNLHSIVYPPRWEMLRDIAERYAMLGIVTSAAELFTEIELWDETVDCLRRAGKEKRAEELVRDRLAVQETPRMWTALGDITGDESYYQKAIEVSNGRFSQAYLSLGQFHFDKGNMTEASKFFRNSLELRPLQPAVWFKVGTISMQLGDWDLALKSFSEVVQQQPDAADAWANVAAVHMHNKEPTEAYPALVEALKQNQNNWRIWISKLYTCLDLQKYDEAIQACVRLLNLRASGSSQDVPMPEEKCVRAIVGGTVTMYRQAASQTEAVDAASLESARRSLSRAHDLLVRLGTVSNESWIFETKAYLHGEMGQDKQVLENLMKEYRSLSSVRSWEKDSQQVRRMCQVVSQIAHFQRGSKEELAKSKYLLSGVIKRVRNAAGAGTGPGEIADGMEQLESLLQEVIELLNNSREA